MANVRFFTCTSAQLEGFTNKADGDLFFVNDTKTIYRYNGSNLEPYGGAAEVEFVNTSGDPYNGRTDILYINSVDKTVKVYNGTAYVTIAEYVTKTTTVGPATGTGAATDSDVPTTKAVRTAIDAAIAENIVDVSVSTSAANAGLAPQLGSDGKLPATVIPALAISEFVGEFTDWTTASASSAVAAAEKGDYLIIKASGSTPGADDGTWILSGSTPTAKASWTQISTPDTDTKYTSGIGIEVTAAGVVNLQKATDTVIGGVKIDGNNLSIAADGTLSATNTWRPVKVGNDTLDDTASTIEFAASGDATITYDSTNKKITFSATDTTYSAGTAIAIDSTSNNAIGVKYDSNSALAINGSGQLTIQWQTIS